MTVYRIRDWDRYENGRTSGLKTMNWVAVPVEIGGLFYGKMMNHADGALHYGVWMALVQVAARSPERGVLLTDTNEPHTIESLSIQTRIPEGLISDAVSRFAGDGFLVLQGQENQCRGNTSPHVATDGDTKPLQESTGQESTGQGVQDSTLARSPNRTHEPEPTPPEPEEEPILTFPTAKKGEEWPLVQSKIDEWRETFPGHDPMPSVRRARQWCIDNPGKRKTARGMPKFLSSWIQRDIDKGAVNGNGSTLHNYGGGIRGPAPKPIPDDLRDAW